MTDGYRNEAGKVVLALPVPPSPNDEPYRPGQATAWRTEIKRDAFAAAVDQVSPIANPPSPVEVRALYRVPDRNHFRDEDNLVGGLKYVLDALKLPDTEGDDPLTYRDGLYLEKGWIVDDAPPHCTIGFVDQMAWGGSKELVVNIIPEKDES